MPTLLGPGFSCGLNCADLFKRSLLLPLAILVFSFTELVVRGCHAAAVVGQNLPPIRATRLACESWIWCARPQRSRGCTT